MNDQLKPLDALAFPDVRMNLCTPKNPCTGKVVRSDLCTLGQRKASGMVRHIAIDVTGTPLAGAGRPGQSFGVLPPGVDDAGKPHKVRLYSYASPTRGDGDDGKGNVIATCVKRVIDEHWTTHRLFEGIASNYLCDLQVGDEVKLTGPVGKRFLLPVNAGDFGYVFIATGTGVAPFRGMLLDLLASGATRPIVLIAGVAYATDMLYHDLFERLAREHANFHYLTAVSREIQPDGQGGPMYVHRRLETHADLLLPILRQASTLLYVCGITGMEVGVFQQMASQLSPAELEPYVSIDGETMHHVEAWNRQMIHREIKPTGRVMMEVYG